MPHTFSVIGVVVGNSGVNFVSRCSGCISVDLNGNITNVKASRKNVFPSVKK